jgi:8-oxo-dGTP diphosphatase
MTTIATLCYIIKYGKVLLSREKKGLAAGKWTGPGGKVEAGEKPEDAVGMRVYEKVKIVPENPKEVGILEFCIGQANTTDEVVHVFIASEFDGVEKETDKAAPKWFPINKIPYSEMWPSDEVWIPLLLQGKKFRGRFYYDEGAKKIIRHEINEVEALAT